MQVHFSGITLNGSIATYRVECEVYCGEMSVDQNGGAKGTGRITFNPTAPNWLGQKVTERIWSQSSLERDFSLNIDPPNAA
jgi:hypothetical protein